MENSLNGVKNIKLKFKKWLKYLQEKIPIYPVCRSKKVVENVGRPRTIIFSTDEEHFKIQGYNCKDKHYNDESQFFKANIDDIVSYNCNYFYEFIDTVKNHNVLSMHQ